MKNNVRYQSALAKHNNSLAIGFFAITAGFAYVMLALNSYQSIWPGVACAVFGVGYMAWAGVRLERKAPVVPQSPTFGPGVL